MGNTKTTIELNGQIYDAVSGKAIRPAAPAVPSTRPFPPHAAGRGTNLDGFIQSGPSTLPTKTTHKPHLKHPVAAHHPQPASTLMRHAVKKPSAQPAQASSPVKAVSAPSAQPAQQSAALPQNVNQERQQRAQAINRSPLVSRFGSGRAPVSQTVTHLPVTPAPSHAASTPPASAPPIQASRPQPVAPIQQPGAQLFSKALQNIAAPAVIPTLPKVVKMKKASRAKRAAAFSMAGVTTLAVVGFGLYIDRPAISLKLANNRAGFSAGLPGYTPAGYALQDSISSSPGHVTAKYTADGTSYNLGQQPSSWTSQSLLENYVIGQDPAYQTFSQSGRTIYVYKGHNATWVNGGIWYTVSGNANLTTDQLLHIANSL